MAMEGSADPTVSIRWYSRRTGPVSPLAGKIVRLIQLTWSPHIGNLPTGTLGTDQLCSLGLSLSLWASTEDSEEAGSNAPSSITCL